MEFKNIHEQGIYEEGELNKKAAILDFNLHTPSRQSFSLVNQYLQLFLLFNTLILLCVLIVFSSYKERFSNILMVFVVSLQIIVLMASFSTLMAVYIVEKLSDSLANCCILEKTIDFCNVSNYNSCVVAIKVQKFRSRYSKYLYYNIRIVVVLYVNAILINGTESQAEYQYTKSVVFLGKIKIFSALYGAMH